MKKIFKLTDKKKHEDRVLEAIKHELRKYIKRENNKDLPDKETMYWDFECKIGVTEKDAKTIAIKDLIKELNTIKKAGVLEVYIEILSVSKLKPPKIEKVEIDSKEI